MATEMIRIGDVREGDAVTELDTPQSSWYNVVTYDSRRMVLVLDDDIPVAARPDAALLRRH